MRRRTWSVRILRREKGHLQEAPQRYSVAAFTHSCTPPSTLLNTKASVQQETATSQNGRGEIKKTTLVPFVNATRPD